MAGTYLCYISKNTSVKRVARVLGQPHLTIKKDLYRALWEFADLLGAKTTIETKYKTHKFKTVRIVKLLDDSPDDLEACQVTLGMQDDTFIPLCFITDISLFDLIKARSKILFIENHQNIIDDISALFKKYITETGSALLYYSRECELNETLIHTERKTTALVQELIKVEFADELKDAFIEIK